MKKNKYENFIFSKLYSKYKIDNTIYALNVIDNIIFNEKSHLVSTFKDYLILDDEFEFMKRYYNYDESIIRLKTFLNYYSKNNQQFPNYSNLKEANIIIKNIFSKQQMAEDLENSIKQRKKEKNDINQKESLSNTIFNSKVYDSIINDTENHLSIFSYDKESLYSGYNIDSRNKKEDGINKLIDHFEEIEKDTNFSFGNKKNKNLKFENSLINDLDFDLETSNKYNKMTDIQMLQNIYKKKKTPNNSINIRKNIIYNTTRMQKQYNMNKNENIDYVNYKNLVLYSENNHNPINIISKKINLNTSPNITKKINNSSMPYLGISSDNFEKTKKIKTQNYINKNKITALKSNKGKINNNIKINENRVNDHLLTERIPQMIKVKINMKKNGSKINKNKIKINNINKKLLKNSEKQQQNIRIDKNKISLLKQKAKIDNKDAIYNHNKKKLISNNLINNSSVTNRDYKIKYEIKSNTYRSHSNNMLKDKKISLTKKNIDNNIHTDYMINKYKNKISNYNNYTSIQFNNNNINIINSDSNNTNNNMNNICYNTYGNYFQKPDDIKIFNNLSNKGNKSQEFKNKRKKLNKKCATYFILNNSEKLYPKLKFNKKLKVVENLNIADDNINTGNNISNINVNNYYQHRRGLMSERISTPFNSKQSKKIFFKVYKKVNLSNNKEKKKETIMNDTYKRYKISFINNKIIKEMNNSSNNDNFDQFNSTQISQFNKTNSNMNSINLNNSNFINLNSSLYVNKKRKNESEIIYYKNNDKNDLFKNDFQMNISKINKDNKEEKKSLNNFGKILKNKKIKKDNELLEIKKLDEQKKMIINQFNKQMNQIKLKFMKEIENKFEISKRNIINKRKNKNKLNVNPCIYK